LSSTYLGASLLTLLSSYTNTLLIRMRCTAEHPIVHSGVCKVQLSPQPSTSVSKLFDVTWPLKVFFRSARNYKITYKGRVSFILQPSGSYITMGVSKSIPLLFFSGPLPLFSPTEKDN